MQRFFLPSLAVFFALMFTTHAQEAESVTAPAPTEAEAVKPAVFTLGGTRIEVPAPEGLIHLSRKDYAKLYSVMQASQPPTNKVQALFYPADEIVDLMEGKRQGATRFAMAYSLQQSTADFSLDTFDKVIKPELRNLGEGKASEEVNKALEDANKRVEEVIGEKMNFDGFQPVHDESDRHISTSISMSQPDALVCGTVSLVLVNARAFCLATYDNASKDRKEGIKASRYSSRAWVHQIQMANPSSAKGIAAERKAYEGTGMNVNAVIGKVAGTAIGMGLLVMLVGKLRKS
jgi:hypothetical protein